MWGDFDTGNGGVIGGKYGSATVLMQNVIVACKLDVFSDVTAAYQWYAYRRCGMLVGYTGQNSPKKATNAAADFLTCENVSVYYGDWVNYNYYQFANQTDAEGNRLWNSNYPWVRAEESPYNGPFSNVRYGNPIVKGVAINTKELAEANKTGFTPITFNQLYGGGQGVYGCATHEGVTVSSKNTKTIYIKNNLDWTNLQLDYWFINGEDKWSTIVDPIVLTEENGVYKVELPIFAHSFKITADGGNETEFTLSDLTHGSTYNVSGIEHEHQFDGEGRCECGAIKISEWELLTSASKLNIGDVVVFIFKDGKMELTSFSNTGTVYGIGTKYDNTPSGTMTFKIVEGNAGNTIAFKTGDKYLNWASGNSLNLVNILSANTSWTVSIDEDGLATVSNSADTTRKIYWNSSSPRFACYTSNAMNLVSIYRVTTRIVCVECDMEVTEKVDATCTTSGYKTETCTVCGNTVTTTIDALGHDNSGTNPYICSRNNCGEVELPEDGSILTIQEAIWVAETLENGKSAPGKYVITGKINKDPSGTYGATDIIDNNGDLIHITIIKSADGDVNYGELIIKPVKEETITVSAKISKNDGGEIQLTEAYLSEHVDTNAADHTCDICGAENVTEHNYVDDICSICGKADPSTADRTGRYYIAAIRTSGNYFYMTSNLGTASTKRYQAVDSGLTELPEIISNAGEGYVFVLEKNDDGTYSIQAEGVEGNNYLGWESNNSGILVAKAEALKLTVDYNEENGTFNIHFEASDAERYLALNSNSGSNYFAWYKSGQKQDLVLIPVYTCPHENKTTTTVNATCETNGSITVTCTDCGATVSTETIDALGHSYDEGVITTPATCTSAGVKTSTCATCGDAKTEAIEALGHSYGDFVQTKAPTCTEDGVNTATCATCGGAKTEAIEALGHSYGDFVQTKAPTCTEDGVNTATCATCGDAKTEAIAATEHSYVDGTCSACGEKEKVEEADPVWTLVTDVANLKANDQIVIVAKDYNYAISTTQNSNNRGQAALTKNGNTITLGNGVQIITLEAGTTSGTFAFNTGSGYLYAASSSGNYLRTETTLSANSSWKIQIDANGGATIVAQGTYTRNTMQYNQSSSLFACYASASQKAISIYKLETGSGNEGGETSCEHTNTTTTTVDATCTDAGSITVTCDDCKLTISTETIEATGHTYVDGACSACGEKDPNAGGDTTEPVETAETLSIFGTTGTKNGTASISWTSGDVTVTNTKGSTAIRTSDSDHYRVYAGSSLKISATDITKVVIICTSSSYANVLSGSLETDGATASINGSTVTVTVTNGTLDEIVFTLTAQSRINKVEVTYTK